MGVHSLTEVLQCLVQLTHASLLAERHKRPPQNWKDCVLQERVHKSHRRIKFSQSIWEIWWYSYDPHLRQNHWRWDTSAGTWNNKRRIVLSPAFKNCLFVDLILYILFTFKILISFALLCSPISTNYNL